MRHLLIIMLFLFQLPLMAASYHANDCCNQRYFILGLPEGLWIDVSPIIWRNCRNDYIYAMNATHVGTNSETNTFNIVEPSYHGGIRVGAGFSCNDCVSYYAEYTYYSSSDSDSTNRPLVAPFFVSNEDLTAPELSTLSLEVRGKYQRIRALGAVYLMNSCCFDFYVFGGLGWLNLKDINEENGKLIAVDSTRLALNVFMKQDMIFNGGTIEYGFGGKYYFYNGFGFSGEFNGVMAIGERSYKFRFTHLNDTDTNDIKNRLRDLVVCVPGFDLRLELLYSTCFCYFPMTIALGYEQHHFFNILLGNPLFLPFASGGTNLSQLQTAFDVGYSGPYVALRFNY